jgi:hypothetical protein
MKHGDKAKSKAASKASGKKSSKTGASAKAGAKVSKGSPIVVKGKKQQAPIKSAKQASAASKAPATDGNGKPVRLSPDNVGFANATVGAAFKRAVKKYPNAFRRLTD